MLGATLLPAGTASAAEAKGILVAAQFRGACLAAQEEDSGASIRIEICDFSLDQDFTIDGNAIRTVVVRSKCLDVQGGAVNNGARVQLWPCNGDPGQLWQFDYMPQFGNVWMMRNPRSGLCLVANNAGAVISNCVPSTAPLTGNLFRLEPKPF